MPTLALVLAALAPQAQGFSSTPADLAARDASRRPTRLLVEFRERSYDLESLRVAIWSGRSAADVATIVADLEARTTRERADFVRQVESLGGRVVHNWWIINGSCVEIDPAHRARIARLPNVHRVSLDEAVPAATSEATDKYNHATSMLHARGMTGANKTAPVSVAIMDSGADSDMNKTGRPHRTYFVNGDPTNKTGGGIGGSRLLENVKVGAMVADDQHGHGTQVAGICAGESWGAPRSARGHAYGARIVSYSIADYLQNGNVWTYYSTMISSWQRIARDKVKHNIVVANNSFSGANNALHASQQALDTTAHVADILITVAAGNAGPNPITGQQSAANGLAVAALYPNDRVLQSWSSRGPVSNDTQRTYPDISAVTYSRTPFPDCEGDVRSFGGTSNAAPQVAGVATVLRANNPKLRALETKALLLASSVPTRPDVKENRNHTGVGMLHAGAALHGSLTRAPSRSTLTDTKTPYRTQMRVRKGVQYGVALTWHRTVYSSMSWSNLDLRILDGSTVVASATTPRNLYERLDFVARSTGTYTIEVSATQIQGSATEFAIATAEFDVNPLSSSNWRGTYYSIATGCTGSGLRAGTQCLVSNPQMTLNDLTNFRAGSWETAMSITASRDMNVTGLELLAWPDEAVTIPVELYRADSNGRPTGNALQKATMQVDMIGTYHAVRFPQGTRVQKGERFCIVLGPEVRRIWMVSTNASFAQTKYFGRWSCSSSWDAISGSVAFGYRVLCDAPAPGATPELSSTGWPTLGSSYGIELKEARPNSVAVLVTGLSMTKFGSLTLPLKIGTTGCALATSIELTAAVPVDRSGVAQTSFQLPNLKDLRGASYYQQCIVLDATANSAGLVTSNTKEAVVGN